MTPRRVLVSSLLLFWGIVGCGYVAAALRQKEHLNLSATAGGQMPYLVYAQQVAAKGLFGHFGDRNRMPLVPILASWAFDDDWNRFVELSSWLAIGLSLVLLSAMGMIAYHHLSPLLATAFLLMVTVTVFGPLASFLQADVPYYALFFCSWWAMSRLLDRPNVWLAIVTGIVLALTYLTKASILLAMPIWLAMIVLRAIWQSKSNKHYASGLRLIAAACVTLLCFLAVAFPYFQNNKERFGRYFYNVNTTFFVWCDSWAQAQQFAEKYRIGQHYPDAPPELIPSARNYWRTHSLDQIARRMVYGLKTLAQLVLASPSFKYLILLGACALFAAFLRPAEARETLHAHRWAIAFTAVTVAAYLVAYSWYVVVAYGDRFVLSLMPPLFFGLIAYLDKVFLTLSLSRPLLIKLPVASQLAILLVLVALADGVAAANSSWITPSPEFVRFYYDESHEELRRENFAEAQRGMRGVTTLDPGFAAAHRDLGMIALTQGKSGEAVEALTKAARLEPTWADVHNSLGSALIQAGRPADAIPMLEKAVALQANFIPAWYNLCGALLQLHERDRAAACMATLQQLAPSLARDLGAAFPNSSQQP